MLNANHIGTALALTFAALFSLCSLLFVAWPSGYMAATGMLFHGFALDQAPHAMDVVAFVSGVLCIAILGYIVGAVYALIFNALAATYRPVETPVHLPR